jgi:transposase
MWFVGIDVASERHVVAAVDDTATVVLSPTAFTEDAEGYHTLLSLLPAADDTLIAMEATGHYWKNLFAMLVSHGFAVALLNPLRTHRFAGEDLVRTKTDAIDALSIARFAAQKRPAATRLPDTATEELRELVRFRDRLVQDFGDRVRQLHRLVDLGFPEFTRYVRDLGSALALALLREYPTAAAFQGVSLRRVAGLRYDGRHKVGDELAEALLTSAARSVGRHHGEAYRLQVRYLCEDLTVLRQRLRDLEGDIDRLLETHEVGRLLTTIDGIGPQTSARLVATFGDFTTFRSGAALAAYVGAIPALRQSGKRTAQRAGLTTIGAAKLRAKLWMPVLSAVRTNPWLRAYYQRLRARGKVPKVALIAAMRKLLHAVYAVATSRRPFVAHVVVTEARP